MRNTLEVMPYQSEARQLPPTSMSRLKSEEELKNLSQIYYESSRDDDEVVGGNIFSYEFPEIHVSSPDRSDPAALR